VEADQRQVGLGDGEVLVVARVGDVRLPLLGLRATAADPRKVEAVARLERRRPDRIGLAHLQMDAVAVELGRHRVAGPRSVERVEVQAGGAVLDQLGQRDVLPERDRRPVEREVVVDELAQVRVARRNAPEAATTGGHRPRELAVIGLPELLAGALRPHPREPERRDGGRGPASGGDDRHLRHVPALAGHIDHTFALDPIALGTVMSHAASLVAFRCGP
jgi:hypothetical protein